jgi:hypothetical protein
MAWFWSGQNASKNFGSDSPGRIVHQRGQDIASNQETSAVHGNSGRTHLGMRTGSHKCGAGDAGELCEASGFGPPSYGGVRKTNAPSVRSVAGRLR